MNKLASPTDAFIDAIAERVAERVAERLEERFRRLEAFRLKEEPEYFTITEAAKRCRKSRKTLYEAIYSGELEYLGGEGHRYLIRRSDLDKWMDRLAGKA